MEAWEMQVYLLRWIEGCSDTKTCEWSFSKGIFQNIHSQTNEKILFIMDNCGPNGAESAMPSRLIILPFINQWIK